MSRITNIKLLHDYCGGSLIQDIICILMSRITNIKLFHDYCGGSLILITSRHNLQWFKDIKQRTLSAITIDVD
jgi:hypothetical protein